MNFIFTMSSLYNESELNSMIMIEDDVNSDQMASFHPSNLVALLVTTAVSRCDTERSLIHSLSVLSVSLFPSHYFILQ